MFLRHDDNTDTLRFHVKANAREDETTAQRTLQILSPIKYKLSTQKTF